MGANNIRLPMNGGAVRPAAYSPPAGASSGIPGASYPVLGSAPVTNMQPRYGNPTQSQLRPGMSQPPLQRSALPLGNQAQQPQMGNRPQQLATALGQMGGNQFNPAVTR